MMAAMMLPSALPAVVSFDRARGERVPIAPGIGFAVAYLAVWTAFGAGAFVVCRGLHHAHPGLLNWDSGGRCLVAATAVAAGLYELTPIKRICLARCRTAGGDGQTLPAALRHAADCAGCSVALMVLLLVIGVMSTTWTVVIAAILLVEKVPPTSPRTLRASAFALVALVAWIAIAPGSAPGLTIPM